MSVGTRLRHVLRIARWEVSLGSTSLDRQTLVAALALVLLGGGIVGAGVVVPPSVTERVWYDGWARASTRWERSAWAASRSGDGACRAWSGWASGESSGDTLAASRYG